MSAVTRPRGPLPARVYWTRRVVVVVSALVLVFALARLLGGSSSDGNQPSAQPVGADASTTASAPTTSADSSPSKVAVAPTVGASPVEQPTPSEGPTSEQEAAQRASETSLPQASGRCSSDDVVATPTIKGGAYAGRPVVFAMRLTARSSAACDFDVSARSLVVKITSGPDRVWSTQDCPGAVPRQSVVVRKDTPVTVDLAWSGQRSDADCTRSPTWAEPGYYHALAAAYGSDLVDEQFRLRKPVRATVTASPTPDEKSREKTSERAKPSKKKRQR